MEPIQEIDPAIGAHGMWKAHLRDAIENGTSEFQPNVVATDNNCAFGKWLHGDISPELKNSKTYPTIVQYHATFHKEAAKILQLALIGEKDEAEKKMSALSEFAAISSSLTSTMVEWKKSLE
ncbi:MAG: CZB domain-containing protein [bacterium]